MQDLPVPPLTHTLEQYARAVAPLQSPSERERTAEVIAEFLQGHGPELQQRLTELSTRESDHGRSYLTEMWLDMYLRTRQALQLVSSVAFQITWPSALSGADLAGDFIHRIAAVHLQYLRGQISPSVGGRGEPLTPTQWHHLAGGLRRPHPTTDIFEAGSHSPKKRTVVVLHRGHAHSLAVSDAEGRPLPASALSLAITQILSTPPDAEGTFADLTPTTSDTGAAILDSRLASERGRATYDALREALFAVDLTESEKSDRHNLRDLAFDPTGVLTHKTTSYRLDLTTGFIGVNLEHSVTDGATLIELIARAKQVEPGTIEGTPAAREPLTWGEDGADVREQIAAAHAEFEEEAASLDVEILNVPGLPDGIVSHDGAMQWILLYGALRTWGQVRSTYEAVDMRHFRAGRTESFRPHTAAALEFVSALIEGAATADLLRAAGRAHSDLIKSAKTGQGIERHLFALQHAAEQTGAGQALFEDPGYGLVTENFLSTTSLGSPDHLTRCAFIPPAPGGLGINYTRTPEGYEFCISSGGATDLVEFCENLRRGAEVLADFVRSLG